MSSAGSKPRWQRQREQTLLSSWPTVRKGHKYAFGIWSRQRTQPDPGPQVEHLRAARVYYRRTCTVPCVTVVVRLCCVVQHVQQHQLHVVPYGFQLFVCRSPRLRFCFVRVQCENGSCACEGSGPEGAATAAPPAGVVGAPRHRCCRCRGWRWAAAAALLLRPTCWLRQRRQRLPQALLRPPAGVPRAGACRLGAQAAGWVPRPRGRVPCQPARPPRHPLLQAPPGAAPGIPASHFRHGGRWNSHAKLAWQEWRCALRAAAASARRSRISQQMQPLSEPAATIQ